MNKTGTSTDLREANLTDAVDFAPQAQSPHEPGPRTAAEVPSTGSYSDSRRQDTNDDNASIGARNSSESWYTYQNLSSNGKEIGAEPRIARGQNTSPSEKPSFESFFGSTPATRNQEQAQNTVPHILPKSDSVSSPKRRPTTLVSDRNNTNPATQDGAVELDAGEPGNIGQWAVDQHLDGLLREIVDDSSR